MLSQHVDARVHRWTTEFTLGSADSVMPRRCCSGVCMQCLAPFGSCWQYKRYHSAAELLMFHRFSAAMAYAACKQNCRCPCSLQVVEFGKYEMDTWYYSPFPEPYASCHKLYICEYSLKYFRKKSTLLRHLAKLEARHPPGDEIYRSPPPPPNNPSYVGGAVTSPPIAMFEVRSSNMPMVAILLWFGEETHVCAGMHRYSSLLQDSLSSSSCSCWSYFSPV